MSSANFVQVLGEPRPLTRREHVKFAVKTLIRDVFHLINCLVGPLPKPTPYQPPTVTWTQSSNQDMDTKGITYHIYPPENQPFTKN